MKRLNEQTLRDFIQKHNIQVREENESDNGKKIILNHCVFNENHTGKDACLLIGTKGQISYKCFHNECKDKKIADFVKHFEPDFYKDDIKAEKKPEILPRLVTIDAGELMKKQIAPLKYIVNDLLPEGFGILAAPPKTYKSFLCMQLCVNVCNGGEILGKYTQECKCLYFDLESSDRRPQNRLKAMGIDPGAIAGRIEFVTQDELSEFQKQRGTSEPLTLANGFDKVLEEYLKEKSDIGLVIIDVFGKIRTEQKKTQQLYEHDYSDTGTLTKIAQAYHVCILAVHHTNKSKDETNVFNNMGGSTGLFGSIDFAWVLDKAKFGDKEATLHTTGKDIETSELAIKFNADKLQWDYVGTAAERERAKDEEFFTCSNITRTVKKLIETNGESWTGTASDLISMSNLFDTDIFEDGPRVGKFLTKYSWLFMNMGIDIRVQRSGRQRMYLITKTKEKE